MESSAKNSPQEAARISRSMLSSAGAWLARLNGPLRTAAAEEGFQRWLREDPRHAQAFRMLTEDWHEMEELRRFASVVIKAPGTSDRRECRPDMRKRPSVLLATAAALGLAAIGAIFFVHRSGVATAVGEQRILILDDGTRVYLNTSSRIALEYDEARRAVRLDSGEALFDVARHAGWPFVVEVGDRKVTALGTSFVVRRDADQRIAITLVEGKVSVSGTPSAPVATGDVSAGSAAVAHAVTLTAGQRLILEQHEVPRVDLPDLGKVTAWQQGKVAIDNMRLSEAVAEMNRYSSLKLVIEQPQSAKLLLSGIFTAGESESFARAVAQTYGLQVRHQRDTIVLAGSATTPD